MYALRITAYEEMEDLPWLSGTWDTTRLPGLPGVIGRRGLGPDQRQKCGIAGLPPLVRSVIPKAMNACAARQPKISLRSSRLAERTCEMQPKMQPDHIFIRFEMQFMEPSSTARAETIEGTSRLPQPRECGVFLDHSSAPSPVCSQIFKNQRNDLGSWVSEIHTMQIDGFRGSQLFSYSNNNFDDASSSALLAATVLHLALLTGDKTFIPQAERTRAALFAAHDTSAPTSTSSQSSSSFNFSSAFAHTPHSQPPVGSLRCPLNVRSASSQSPGGQRDWNAVGNSP
ncbi:hypothetical protein BGY98DRAFT_1178430 [Russula aff. rugulosa BPL654]|nr:hypothetical protein BGY98DRAFT_1178430 [Russula aff. rugulosa BPL654]